MTAELLFARSDAHPAGYRDLSPLAALHHLGELRLIDVREPDEFVGPLGHIPGAELVPLSSVADAAANWDRNAPLLLICRSGGRSARAATALAGMGFQQLFNLVGGMLAWEANALPQLREDDSPTAQLAGQLKAYFVAAAGGDTQAASRAFDQVVGPDFGTPEGFKRALEALAKSDGITTTESAHWVDLLKSRFGRLE